MPRLITADSADGLTLCDDPPMTGSAPASWRADITVQSQPNCEDNGTVTAAGVAEVRSAAGGGRHTALHCPGHR